MWQLPELFLMFLPVTRMVGEACLPSNAYYPRTPDYTLCSGVHVCWFEHSDSSFVYGFMSLDYGFGTMTATTYYRNKALTAKLLRQCYRYFKLRKAFSKFYRRHSALLEKYSVSLKTLLQQGISEPELFGAIQKTY